MTNHTFDWTPGTTPHYSASKGDARKKHMTEPLQRTFTVSMDDREIQGMEIILQVLKEFEFPVQERMMDYIVQRVRHKI